jgi:hypothetical protein
LALTKYSKLFYFLIFPGPVLESAISLWSSYSFYRRAVLETDIRVLGMFFLLEDCFQFLSMW